MTWAKYGTEFFDQLAEFDLPADMDDVCQLTHTQVLHYLYSTEDMSATFLKKNLRRIASSSQAEAAGKILASFGVWADLGNKYEIIHHADVFRQSLGYQEGQRESARNRKRNERAKKKGSSPDGPGGGVDVTEDVTRDVLETQTDRQTGIQSGMDHPLDGNALQKAQVAQGVDLQTGELLSSEEVAPRWPSAPEDPLSDADEKFRASFARTDAEQVGGGPNGLAPEVVNRWRNRASA